MGVSFWIGAFEEEGVVWSTEWSMQVEWVELLSFICTPSLSGLSLHTTAIDFTQYVHTTA